MLRIKIGTNTGRIPVIVSENDSLQKVLTDNNISFARASIHINGVTMGTSDFGKTIADLGLQEDAIILACTKTDNA